MVRNSSFSHRVKSELVRVKVERSCCKLSEIAAVVHLRGFFTVQQKEKYLSISLDNNAVARHIFLGLKKITGATPVVLFQQGNKFIPSQYLIQVKGTPAEKLMKYLGLKRGKKWNMVPSFSKARIKSRCCRRNYLRGAFLAGGSLSFSGSGYHLEICSEYEVYARMLQQLMRVFGIEASVRSRKKIYYTYVKSVERIMDFLRITRAFQAVLFMEEQRIIKSIRNQTNRLVNCETANLDKSIRASYQQMEFIKKIEQVLGLEALSPPLREAAELRMKNPEASLKELGEMLSPPVGKSGMNHRFRKLKEIATRLDQTRVT